MDKFLNIIDWVLSWEGGYSNDPDDPGGETKFGIAKRYHPNVDIANLTREDAIEIYRKEYWDTPGCGRLALPLAWCMLDAAIQHGHAEAVRLLTQSHGDWESFNLARMEFYWDITNRSAKRRKYFFGWIGRVVSLNERCRAAEATKNEQV